MYKNEAKLSFYAPAEGTPQGVLHPPVEGDSRDGVGEEGERGGTAEGVQGAASSAWAQWDRGGGRGFGTDARCGCG